MGSATQDVHIDCQWADGYEAAMRETRGAEEDAYYLGRKHGLAWTNELHEARVQALTDALRMAASRLDEVKAERDEAARQAKHDKADAIAWAGAFREMRDRAERAETSVAELEAAEADGHGR